MNIKVTSRHFNASEQLKELVNEKVKKIEKFNNEIISCNVILTKENNSENVEIIVHAKGHDFISSENEDIFERSLINAVYKISNQIKKQHEKAIGR
jgi:putative sigma-54 modulation protein